MILPSRTTFFKKIPITFYVYVLFIALHVFLFNVNVSEWGDSYRILRASEFIRQGSYPIDEKRPPLFSIILSVRPDSVDPVVWGRVVMFIFSVLSLYIFDKLTKIQVKNEKYRLLALLLFIFNPVYLYWSIRIMADVPLSFICLLSFYLISKWKDLNYVKTALLGFLSGLAILTRYEGYLLFTSLLVAVILSGWEFKLKKINIKFILDRIWKSVPKVIVLGLTTLLTILPWLIYRNPLKSQYFNEPSGRSYDFRMVWIYFSSILYIFGFTGAFFFIFKNFKTVNNYFKKNIGIATFFILELILILLWPAAIPRLFTPLIPFFVIILVLSIENFLENESDTNRGMVLYLASSASLIFFYVFSQYFLKLQFLVPVKILFAIIVILQVISILFFYIKKVNWWLTLSLISTVFWSMSVIYMHRNIYTAVKSAAMYSREKLNGKILYNDTTSIMEWYINDYNPKPDLQGLRADFLDKESLGYEEIENKNISYVATTNEDGIGFDRGVEKLEYLKLIQSFRYNIGDAEFFVNIFKFER